jgi:hypothetical protein
VLAIQLFAFNSAIDIEILQVQTKKYMITSELMEAIIRRPEESPDIRKIL